MAGYNDSHGPVKGDLAVRVEAFERRLVTVEDELRALRAAKAAPAAKPPAMPKPLTSAPLKRLAIGEELHGPFVEERRLTGEYGEFLAIVLSVDGSLVTLSCQHRALHNAIRKLRPAVGDHVAVKRLPDGISKSTGRGFANYMVRVARAEPDGVFDR